MERFVKINKQVKNNLFKICRLCGIDNPNKIGILEEVVFLSDDGEIEPPLYKKIFNCVGIQVTPDDKMPKTVCALCFDKINDFHEFREMCYVTNVQTRKLLGLSELPKLELKWALDEAVHDPVAATKDNTDKKTKIDKKGKKRKIAEPPPGELALKQVKHENPADSIKNEIKIENELLLNKVNKKLKGKLDKTVKNDIITKGKNEKNKLAIAPKGKVKQEQRQIFCNICRSSFASAALLQSHLLKTHIPLICRYFCVKCNENMEETIQIKSHNLWHKLTKTPYQCGRCDKETNSLQGLTRHIRECHLLRQKNLANILPNVVCKFCLVEFQTKNLYFMHNCVTRTLQCPKCKCKLSNQLNTLKHIASCNAKIRNEEEMDYIIKAEPVDTPPVVPLSVTTIDSAHGLSLPTPSISKSKASKTSVPSLQLTSTSALIEIRNPRANHTMVVIPSASTVKTQETELLDPTANKMRINDDFLPVSIEIDHINKTKVTGKKHKEDAMMARCSVLLQDTLRTLDNIKQEPFETTNASLQHEKHQNEINENEIAIENLPTPHIKQEIIDENYKEVESNLEINIKQEVISYPTISQPAMPALKLKIKKEHGTLNSSFIDYSENEAIDSYRKKKKNSKKKIKEVGEKSSIEDSLTSPSAEEIDSLNPENKLSAKNISEKLDFPLPVTIKVESMDPSYEDNNDNMDVSGDDFHHYDDYNSENENDINPVKEIVNATIPIISNIQTVTKFLNNNSDKSSNEKNTTEDESSTIMQISCVTSGVDTFEQLKSNENNINLNKEKSDKSIFEETESSISQENKSCTIPQIVAVTSGINLSETENIASVNNEDETIKSNDITIPQISHISSGVSLKNQISELNNEFDYSNVLIKEEPDYGDYCVHNEENITNICASYNENELENTNEHNTEENSAEFQEIQEIVSNEMVNNDIIEVKNKMTDKLELQSEIKKQNKILNKEKYVGNKQKNKSKKIRAKNFKEKDLRSNLDNEYSDDITTEEEFSDDEIPEENVTISDNEYQFDPNIKIKQEIEFSEEIIMEDNQYEYGSDGEDNDENEIYDNDYHSIEFNNRVKSPSPVKELQPIIMEMNIIKEQNKNILNDYGESNIFNSKQKEQNICNDNNKGNKNDFNLQDREINRQTTDQSSESANKSIEIENFGFKKIRLLNFTTINNDQNTSISNTNCNIENIEEINLSNQNQYIPEISSELLAKPQVELSSEIPADQNLSLNKEHIEFENNMKDTETLNEVSVTLDNACTNNMEDSVHLNVEDSIQIPIRLPKLENINEIAENHNNENFEKMLRNEIDSNNEEQNQSNSPIIAQGSSINVIEKNFNNEIENNICSNDDLKNDTCLAQPAEEDNIP